MNKNNEGNFEGKSPKLRLLVIKKKSLIAVVLSVVIVGVCLFGGIGIASSATSMPNFSYTVVIDPGHGGIDGGVVSQSGYKESVFNLEMATELQQLLSKAGFKVIMTRTDEKGLYGETDSNKKRADMEARKKIVVDNSPDFVISIHANKFPGDSRRGAQVFFDSMSEEGKVLAESIQSGLNILNSQNTGREFSALSGDYFMLKCTVKPSVIVECGFLSNAEDEKLLSDREYRAKLAFAIYSGIVGFCER